MQDHGEENGRIGTAAGGLHDVRVNREGTVGDDVTPLIIGDVTVVDEAQAVGVERLLILENQRQIRAGQTQMPQAASGRGAGKLVENRVMTGGNRVLVDRGTGFRRRRATVTTVRGFLRNGDQGGSPAVIMHLTEITEFAYGLHAEHTIETGVAACGRESK